MLDAELDVALVVDAAGVGELVRLEPHQGGRLPRAVLELTHDLVIHGTPVLMISKYTVGVIRNETLVFVNFSARMHQS